MNVITITYFFTGVPHHFIVYYQISYLKCYYIFKPNMQLKESQYKAIFSMSVRFQGAAGQSKAGFLLKKKSFHPVTCPVLI